MPGLIGKKIGMTSIFGPDGKNMPCTVLEVGPCVVTQVKTEDVDGYNAIQLSFGEKKEKRATQAEIAHAKKAGTGPKRKLVEFNDMSVKITNWETLLVQIFSSRASSSMW